MSSGRDKPFVSDGEQALHPVTVCGHQWLTANTFEIRFRRPPGFNFLPGQKIRLVHKGIQRDYTLISGPDDDELTICVRHIPRGRMSPLLAHADAGWIFHTTPAFGFFVYQSTRRMAVFAATGTGIAPFVAFVRAGAHDFRLLHGVRSAEELYYKDILAPSAKVYLPCLSAPRPGDLHQAGAFAGRVTGYLENQLPSGDYDFYLCGRGEMVRDALRLIDRRFPEARVFTETFF